MSMDKVIEAREGETILEAAISHDIPIMHACGGFCACTTCHIKVLSGESNLSPIEDDEEERLDAADGVALNSRLGCQAKIKGEVTVEIVNLDQ
jgi:2Fe-2S ferredoxin